MFQHTHTSLLELVTTLDADQQSSSNTELLCEGGSKEQMDVTELPVNLDSEGQVRTDCNSLMAAKNLSKDFGIIYSCSNVPNDFIAAIQRLTSTERYSLLKHHVVPPYDHIFPVSSFGKSNRKFKPKWLTQNTWMVYSTAVDGVFCKFCALFSDCRHTKLLLVNKNRLCTCITLQCLCFFSPSTEAYPISKFY